LRLLSFIALGATSCTAVSPALRFGELGFEVRGTWAAAGGVGHPVDSAWLKRFRDPQLNSLVAEALRNNPDMAVAAARVDQAAEQAAIVGSASRPNAQLSLAASRSRRNFVGFPEFGSGAEAGEEPAGEPPVVQSLSNSFGPSLDVAWEIDVWGRVRAAESAARAGAEAAEMDFAAARVSLVAQVAKAYFALAEAEEQVRLARETLEAFEATEQAIGERFRTGQAEGQIVGAQFRLAKSDVASARAAVQQTSGVRDEARRRLETLVGRHASGRLRGRATLPDPPAPPPAGLPSELLLRRPDVLAAERRFAAQGKRILEGKRALFPQLQLTGSLGASTDDLASVVDSDFGVWTLAGNVVQPILTGGRLRAEVRLREAEEREALGALQKAVIEAFGEVETALAADAFLARRETALREAVALATEADVEARAAFRDGVGDILTVFTAQNRRLNAQAAFIAVRRQRLDNRINLHLALGGDYQPRRP
jgi:NodT family efflux transporter outer membrane factor (OMF) lipoprotein